MQAAAYANNRHTGAPLWHGPTTGQRRSDRIRAPEAGAEFCCPFFHELQRTCTFFCLLQCVSDWMLRRVDIITAFHSFRTVFMVLYQSYALPTTHYWCRYGPDFLSTRNFCCRWVLLSSRVQNHSCFATFLVYHNI